MNKEKEKQIVYKGLVELTEAPGDSNAYFTRGKIMEHIKQKAAEERGAEPFVSYRSAHVWDPEKGEEVKISLDGVLPRYKNLPGHLEELIQEGKASKVMPISQGWEAPYERGTELLYRANLE